MNVKNVITLRFTINPAGTAIAQCVRELIKKSGWIKEKRIF
jgi:hypothetical protein